MCSFFFNWKLCLSIGGDGEILIMAKEGFVL
jgi:hypothetical protein